MRIAAISLADEPPFHLGELYVRPATRQLVRAEATQTLEPRVMEVLVALARAHSEVVSRDALIDSCWGGRIVGENAIHRVTSRIRQLAATIGEDCFEIETISKVGYRLIVREAPPDDSAPRLNEPIAAPSAPASNDRRLLLGVLATTAIGLTGFGAWRAFAPERRGAATARTLAARGREALRQDLGEQDIQAVAYFKQATQADPASAEAWGGLALGQLQLLKAVGDSAGEEAAAAEVRSAARRALALDPDNGDARAALILIRPFFRNWTVIEADCRAALRQRPNPVLESALAEVLAEAGLGAGAIAIYERLLAHEPFDPDSNMDFAWTLWMAGDLARAGQVLDNATKLWPGHLRVWLGRFMFLALAGRPSAAIGMVEDVEARPAAAPRSPVIPFDVYVAAARALLTHFRSDINIAVSGILDARARGVLDTPRAVSFLAALGAVDAAFGQLDNYYFGPPTAGGRRRALGPYSDRTTRILFMPASEPLRVDRRFAPLTRAIGLDGYWRATGSVPDYRR